MVDTVEAFWERDLLWDDVMEYYKCAFDALRVVRRWQYKYDLKEGYLFFGDDSEPPSELLLDLEDAETVAEHVFECFRYSVGLHTRLNYPHFIDRSRVDAMLFIHDAGEVYAGEITVFQGKPEGFKQTEREGFIRLLRETGCFTDRLLTLYDEYENEESIEALFAKFIDRYQGNMYFYQHQRKFTPKMLNVSRKRIDDVYQKICQKVAHMEIESGVRNEFLRELDTIVRELNVVPYFAHAVIIND